MKKAEYIERYGEEAYQRELERSKKYYHQHREEHKEATKQDLIDWGIYYNRPASELIFFTVSEHSKLHRRKYGV